MSVQPGDAVLDVLQKGEITLEGEFMWGSNYTFLVNVKISDHALRAVYKPTRGERPLWDFPVATLARREKAAYLVSEALGWKFVPPTVYRSRGPLGSGSLQLFIEHDSQYHYFNFNPTDRQRLRSVALFDLLINNADRKGSHILLDPQNHLWLIDHGICFHREDKLRTVIWDFAGETLPTDLSAALRQFHQTLLSGEGCTFALKRCLTPSEIAALLTRAERLLHSNCFPEPDPSRRTYPWPPL